MSVSFCITKGNKIFSLQLLAFVYQTNIMAAEKSSHILTTSSNLLGFCLVVLTSIKISKFSTATFIDEITGLSAIMLMISCILSIRSKNEIRSEKIERVAEIIFLIGLISLAIIIVLVSFNLFA
jgi:hypothetical protein